MIALIPPRPPGYERNRELFDPHTGLIFDPLAAAESWVNTALDLLFNPQRLAGVVEQNARGKSKLTLPEIFEAVLQSSGAGEASNDYEAALGRLVESQCVTHLLALAANPASPSQVNAEVWSKLTELEARWNSGGKVSDSASAHQRYLGWQIENFRLHPKESQESTPAKIPDGSPIGCGGDDFVRALGTEPPG